MHLLGAYVAKDSLVCCRMDRHGNELQHFRVANSRKGLAALQHRLKQPTRATSLSRLDLPLPLAKSAKFAMK
jgi:hypothetical protein